MSNFPPVAIIGAGPAGLMAADIIAQAGYSVSVFDSMPSVGRKFLLAGIGGMNITHSEEFAKFISRFGAAQTFIEPHLNRFDSHALCEWVHSLGIETFVGSSGRVFPKDMKAAPLLRAWMHGLREKNVQFFPRHRWNGWTTEGDLLFSVCSSNNDEREEKIINSSATVLALGGASWPRLGSDGSWVSLLRERGVEIADLQPSNCGFDCDWSEFIRTHCAGEPLQTVGLSVNDTNCKTHYQRGECVITDTGIEGGAIYALSSVLREEINLRGSALLSIDLLPDFPLEKIIHLLQKSRGKLSWQNYLRKQFQLPSVKAHLLREFAPVTVWQNMEQLAGAIKSLPIALLRPRPIAEAISSAGGIRASAINSHLMLTDLPGVFCAGEMLDWEAPTGGYLLTACFALGRTAGTGVVDWLNSQKK